MTIHSQQLLGAVGVRRTRAADSYGDGHAARPLVSLVAQILDGRMLVLTPVATWAQLGVHRKPCGLLNVEGDCDPLLGFFDHAVAERLVRPAHHAPILEGNDPERPQNRPGSFQAPPVQKWIDRADI